MAAGILSPSLPLQRTERGTALTAETQSPPRPGLRDEFGETRRAAGRLFRAHLDLLRAEIGEITGRVKVIAALGGAMAGLGLFLANLLLIGTLLFLGEWLFGSLGWGVLHGTLLGAGILTALALVLFSAPRRVIFTSLIAAAAVGLLVAIVLALNLPRAGATAAGAAVPGLDQTWAPAIVGAVVGAVLFGIVGLVLGARAGGGGAAVGWLVAGAVLGGLLGWALGGVRFSPHGAAAVGIAVGLALWPLLQAQGARAAKVNPKARFERLWPRETYETALETRAWLEQEWARRRERLVSR